MADMCHHTQPDYQDSNPPLRLTGWVRGLQRICRTKSNPGPSISGVKGRGDMLLLPLLSLSMYVWGAMWPWIRFVALADIWTDSCQQTQNTMYLCCPWAIPDCGEANPVSMFSRSPLLQWVSMTSHVLTLPRQQTTPLFVCEILGRKHFQMGAMYCQWCTRVNK